MTELSGGSMTGASFGAFNACANVTFPVTDQDEAMFDVAVG